MSTLYHLRFIELSPRTSITKGVSFVNMKDHKDDVVWKEGQNYQPLIDALTANIALLDADGVILLVNRSWKDFSDANAGQLGNYGIGLNYLGLLNASACRTRPESAKLLDDQCISVAVASGIIDVLEGKRTRFQIEYPCHSPTEERWFLLTVTPFTPGSLVRVVVAHENITKLVMAEKRALSQGQRLADGFRDMVKAIGLAIEKRDPYTAGHQRQVAALCEEIGRALGLPDDELFGLSLGASIHDIGKISAPADILNRPGKLSALEFMIIQTHSEQGYDILKGVDFPWPIATMVWQHHERWDGSGYPLGLQGEAICLGARIIAVADTFDAITSHRPYRPGRARQVAIDELLGGRGAAFDPQVVDAAMTFLETVDADWFASQALHASPPVPFQ